MLPNRRLTHAKEKKKKRKKERKKKHDCALMSLQNAGSDLTK